MPIDKMYTDAMLGQFRNMVAECDSRNLTGENVDTMKAMMQRMEDLAEEMDDFNEYSAKLTTEGLFQKFSDAYSRALGEAAKQADQSGSVSGDEQDQLLLKNTLDAYESAKEQLKNDDYGELIIPAIDDLINLGKSGISYPKFLTETIKRGLDLALEGHVASREGLVQALEWSKDSVRPVETRMDTEILETFDALAAKSPFNIPDSFEFQLKRIEIEWRYKPERELYDAVKERWETLLELLFDWLDAYTKFAPYDSRWRTPGASEEQVRRNIKFTKECNPGFFKERLRIFKESFDLGFRDIFEHETFINESKAFRVPYSDERLDLIKRTFEVCKPFENPSDEMIKEAEKLHDEKRCYHPQYGKLGEKAKREYEKRFGKLPERG